MTILAVALALSVGLSLGLLGGGGSILTLPILLYAVGMAPKPAIATSLVIVAGASFVAMLAHARAGRIAWGTAASFGAASMTTAYAAGRLAHDLSGPLLLAAFTAIMLLTGAAMLRRAPSAAAREPRATRALAAGAGVGVVTGLVGAGGGFLIVPALTMFGGLDMPRAVGTSLLIITLNSVAGLGGYLGHVELPLDTAAMLTLSAAGGSVLGSVVSRRIAPARLRRGFALFVLSMGAWMAAQQLPSLLRAPIAHDARVTHLFAALAGGALTYLSLHLRIVTKHAFPFVPVHASDYPGDLAEHRRVAPMRERRAVARNLPETVLSQDARLLQAAKKGESR